MKIIVYDDTLTWGGHEVMMVKLVSFLSDLAEIKVFVSERNQLLINSLHKVLLGSNIYAMKYFSLEPETIRVGRRFLYRKYISTIEKEIIKFNPNKMIIVQGDIELSSLGIVLSKKLGIENYSYIALLQRKASIGSKLGYVRDIVNKSYYKNIDNLVTITPYMMKLAYSFGFPKERVFLLKNFVEKTVMKADVSRKRNAEFVIGIIGRLVQKQKNQMFVIRMVKKYYKIFKQYGIVFYLYGEGKDKKYFEENIPKNIQNMIYLKGLEKSEIVYNTIDMCLLSSFFEGLPLVFLEAMAYQKPFLAKRIPEYQEIIPEECLFSTMGECVKKILKIYEGDFSIRLNESLMEFYDENRFREDVRRIFL